MVMLLLVSSGSNIFSEGEAVALYAPRPAYSPKWPEGKGVFVLHLDTRSGKVVSVSVAKSTGTMILDQSAVAGAKTMALSSWSKSCQNRSNLRTGPSQTSCVRPEASDNEMI